MDKLIKKCEKLSIVVCFGDDQIRVETAENVDYFCNNETQLKEILDALETLSNYE